ncbi:type II secretion system minor pseudopilin GspK [Paraburkholderia phenoliruptrix]|uniref:Type II secretion system minor pseudopilin GspK n=1 Tax=Paraburkholderia phenoliruptrix TaxID=252970 RepID=A0ABV3WIY7_9BURK
MRFSFHAGCAAAAAAPALAPALRAQRGPRGAARSCGKRARQPQRPQPAQPLQQRPRSRQRGAAIISALLVVALSAILVSGMLWRQQVQVRRIENQRLLAQAQWVARGALDWTRLILRSEGDTSAGITYLGGVWGVPIAKTRLSDFLGQIGEVRAQQGAATYLSGSIEDAQAKFNLRNLVASPAPGVMQLDAQQIGAYQRLLVSLGVNSQLAKNTAVQVRASLMQSATRFQTVTSTSGTTSTQAIQGGAMGGATSGGFTDKPGIEDSEDSAAHAPLQMTSVDSLLDIPGYTPEMVARLRPFVTVLPTVTAVNMNTASAEVIAAVVPGMSLSSAQAFVARRQTVFFHNVGDVQLALRGAGVQQVSIDPNQFDVNTNYFLIHGRVQHERAEVDRTTLVYRDALTHTTRIVRVQDQL